MDKDKSLYWHKQNIDKNYEMLKTIFLIVRWYKSMHLLKVTNTSLLNAFKIPDKYIHIYINQIKQIFILKNYTNVDTNWKFILRIKPAVRFTPGNIFDQTH